MNDSNDELRDIVARHATTRQQQTPVRGLTLVRVAGTTAPVDGMYRPTICVAVQGRKQVAFGERVFTYDARSYLLATVDVPVRGCVTLASEEEPYLGLMFDLDPGRLAEVVLEVPASSPAEGAHTGLVSARMDRDLLDALTRLARLLDRPVDAPVLAPLLEREICYWLLRGEGGGAVRQVATAGSHVSAIAKAAAWIKVHYAEATSVEELAAIASMSVTSFHRHFKAITSTSPLQYRTAVRLQEARRKILAEGLDAGSIGLDVGYESASQFSREYRKMFGIPPGADAARLRAPAR